MPTSCRRLEAKSDSHGTLLARIPAVQDLQAAWLILLFCASVRANFLLRALPLQATYEFSLQHDKSLRRCLSTFVGVEIPEHIWDVVSLTLSLGGLGLQSAQRVRHAASWASWSDSLAMVVQRHTDVVGVMVRSLQARGTLIHLDGVANARQFLIDAVCCSRLGRSRKRSPIRPHAR